MDEMALLGWALFWMESEQHDNENENLDGVHDIVSFLVYAAFLGPVFVSGLLASSWTRLLWVGYQWDI